MRENYNNFTNLAFGIKCSLVFTFIICLFAIYSTQFSTLLFPSLILILVAISLSSYKKEKSNYPLFLIPISFVFYWLYTNQMISIFNIKAEEILMSTDFQFYINKGYVMQKTGVESITNSLYETQDHPSFYHYFDVWYWGIIASISKYFKLNDLFFNFSLPFLLTLVQLQFFSILKLFNFKKYNITIVYVLSLLAPLIVPVIQMSFGYHTDYYQYLIYSVVLQPKFIFITLLLNLLLYFFYTKSYHSFVLMSIASCLMFITVLPGVAFFAGIVSIFLIYKKEIKFDKKTTLSLVTIIVSIFIIALLYKNLLFDKNENDSYNIKSNLPFLTSFIRRLSAARDSIIILWLFIPYFSVLILKKCRISVFNSLKIITFSPILIIIGGSIGWVFALYLFTESNQFFYTLYASVFSVIISLIYINLPSKKIIISISVVILFFSFIINAKFNTIQHLPNLLNKKNDSLLNQFIEKPNELITNTAYLNLEMKNSSVFSEYFIGDHFLYPYLGVMNSVFLDDKNRELLIKTDPHFISSLIKANANPFYKFSQKNKNSLEENQINFIKKYNVKYLTIKKPYPISNQITSFAKDSLFLNDYNGKIVIYKF